MSADAKQFVEAARKAAVHGFTRHLVEVKGIKDREKLAGMVRSYAGHYDRRNAKGGRIAATILGTSV